MNKWTIGVLGLLATFAVSPRLYAQVNPQVGVDPAGVAGAAAPTSNIWSMLLPSAAQRAGCRAKIINSPLGEVLKSAAKPINIMSGGLLCGKCLAPTAADLAALAAAGKLDSAEGAAAQIKKSEAEAKARREAIRYLGTVDCNYWPEAKDALKTALRSDPNECVRFEAALSLGRGCCCNEETIKALKHSANGSKADGFPAESSPRVRAAAADAFFRCAEVYTESSEIDRKGKEGPNGAAPGATSGGARRQGLAGIFVQAASPSDLPRKLPSAPSEPEVIAPMAATNQPMAHSHAPALQPPPAPAAKRGLIQILFTGANPSSAPAHAAPVLGPIMESNPMTPSQGFIILDRP
ncbi:MAG: HEAT repeat domain-containing protein [Gemmataceae bacterium]|nr:HEAT repeat domain-containing protein [Gemmataceae bacterium]